MSREEVTAAEKWKVRTRWEGGRETEDLGRSRANFRTVLVMYLVSLYHRHASLRQGGVFRFRHTLLINQATKRFIYSSAGTVGI